MNESKIAIDVERCRAFWAREEVDRPLLAAWVGSYEMAGLFPNGLAQLREGELSPDDIQVESFRRDYEVLLEKHSQVAADVPWSAFPLMVVPWVEAIAGCPVVHRAGNVWAEPWLDSYERLNGEHGPRLDWLAKLEEFTEWLVSFSGGRIPVAVSLMRGPADVLAAMRGAQNSVLDLMDSPNEVERTLDWIAKLWIRVARAQLSHIPPFGGGYGWSVQNLWSEAPGVWFQDDALAYWSPSLYSAYAAQREMRLAECVARTGIHLHSPALFAVDGLLKMPALDVIEVNLDDVGETIPQMIPTFRRILESQRLYVWGHFTEDDLVTIREELPAKGLALQLMYETPTAVSAMIRRVEEIWAT